MTFPSVICSYVTFMEQSQQLKMTVRRIRLEERAHYMSFLKWFWWLLSSAKQLSDCWWLTLSLLGRQVSQPEDVSPRQQQGLERPGGPVGDHSQPIRALHHYSHLGGGVWSGVSVESCQLNRCPFHRDPLGFCCVCNGASQPLSSSPQPPCTRYPDPFCISPSHALNNSACLQQGVQLSSA